MRKPLVDEIFGSYVPLILLSGEQAYIGVGAALQVIEWLEAHGVAILGIEGFSSDGVALRPLLDFIADFSTIEGPNAARAEAAAREARHVIQTWGRGPEFLEFVIDE